MIELYFSIKWLHILGACIGFGSNVTHLFWIFSANRDPVHRANTLRLVKKIDDRLAVPAWGVTFVAGITMWIWQWPANTSWIITSLVLGVVLMIMGISYGPFMKGWIRMAEDGPDDSPRLAVRAKRLTFLWGVITVNVFIILYLMVRKPMLW